MTQLTRRNAGVAVTTQGAQASPSCDERIRGIDRELKDHSRKSPMIVAVFLLLAGIALLAYLGKTIDVPDERVLPGLGVLLFASFVLWVIKEHKKSERFAADFYVEMLPAVLKKAYAAYAPRTADPAPALFGPAEDWRLPTTVTLLVLSMSGSSFHAQGIYRIEREYFKANNGLGTKDNDESGQYRLSQDLIWKVRVRERMPFSLSLRTASETVGELVSGMVGSMFDRLTKSGMRAVETGDAVFDRSFRVRADDVTRAAGFLAAHRQQLMELRDSMGRFSLDYADGMLTLSFSDFAPIDTGDTYGVRRNGLPSELSPERIAESARELDGLSDLVRVFTT